MRKYLLSGLVLLSFGHVLAQENTRRELCQKSPLESCELCVVYDFHYTKDTIKRKPLYDRQILEIGQTMSRYYSLFGEKIDSLYANVKEGPNGFPASFRPHGWKTGNEAELYEDFYKNYPQQNILTVSTGLCWREYVYTESLPEFGWEMVPAQPAEILGYACQKAVMTFRGREYEVWYTPEVPVNNGPWKLGGLPGLILRAKTLDGLFSWEAIGLSQPRNRLIYFYDAAKSKETEYPMKFVKISRKQLRKLQQMRWTDPIGLQALHGMQGEIWLKDPKTGKITKYDKPGSYQRPYIPQLELE